MDPQKAIYVYSKGNWELTLAGTIYAKREITFKSESSDAIVKIFRLIGRPEGFGQPKDFWIQCGFNNESELKPLIDADVIKKGDNGDYLYNGPHSDNAGSARPVLQFILKHGEFKNPAYAKLVQKILDNPHEDYKIDS